MLSMVEHERVGAGESVQKRRRPMQMATAPHNEKSMMEFNQAAGVAQ